MSWADVLFSIMSQGDFFGAVMQSYENVLGGWFYLMLMTLALTMIYMKTRDFGTVGIVGILASFGIMILVPSIAFFAITMVIILAVGIILYRVFR